MSNVGEEIRTIGATCLCGDAKHDISIPLSKLPLKTYICHCHSCRHYTGTLCLTLALMPRIYQPSWAFLAQLQQYKFSEKITQHFCPRCGTKLFLEILISADDRSGARIYGVPSGTLEEADGILKVLGHEHIQDTLDGGFSDFVKSVSGDVLPRWPGHFEEQEHLPPYWTCQTRHSQPPGPGDRLHGHCKCGNINFWISRPSGRSALAKASWPDVLIAHHSAAALPPESETWWLRDERSKFLAGVCSCDSCRLASGMEWVQWAFVPTVDISLDADGKEPFRFDFSTLKCYRSSSEARRFFCGNCGAMVFWDGDDRPMLKDVAVGLLEAPEGARAERWLEWRTERLSFREDAVKRAESLTLAVENGLAEYGNRLKI